VVNRIYFFLFCITGLLAALFSPYSHAGELSKGSQAVPTEMVRLLHKDTTAFVYIESPRAFSDSLKELYPAVMAGRSAVVNSSGLNPKLLLESLVITKNEIMIEQPIGIGGWGTAENNSTSYVVIFRVEGATPKTVMAKGKGRRLMFLEKTDWIAVTNAKSSWTPAAENAPSPSVVQNMLPGQCVMSFDQAAYLETASRTSINEQIKKSLKGSVQPDMQKQAIDAMEALVYGFKRWDFSVVAAEGDLTFDARYEPTTDSKFKIAGTPGLEQLSRRLPRQLAFQSVISTACVSSMLEWIKPVVIAQAGKDKQLAASLLADLSALIASQQKGCGMAVGMSEHGLDLAQVFQVEDVSTTFGLIDAYIGDINAAKAGLHYKRMPVLVGGDSSRLYEVSFNKKDMKEANPALRGLVDSNFVDMLDTAGDDKASLRIISNGTWMAVVAGTPKLLGGMRRALSQPSVFASSLDAIAANTDGDLIMAMSIDLRSLFNGMLAYVHADPKELKHAFSSKVARSIMSKFKPIPGPPVAMSASAASHDDGAVTSSFVCEVEQVAALCWEIWEKWLVGVREAEEATQAEEAKKSGKK
jgi:hypothetical protein